MIIFYTDKFVPTWAAGCARGPLIFIRPKYKNDIGLRMHEWTHVKQWLMTFGVHSMLYLMSKRYKLWAEVQAYKEQLKFCLTDKSELFAGFISSNYGLDVTKEEVLILLKSK